MPNLEYIPNVLTWQDLNLTSREAYKDMFQKVYDTIGHVDLPEDRYRLVCNFFLLDNNAIEALKIRIPDLVQNFYYLWKILMWIINPISNTRDFKEGLLAIMTNNDLNTKIIRWYSHMRPNGQQGDPPLYDSYIAFIRKCSNISAFILKKTQKAKILYNKVKSWTNEINNLEAAISTMIIGGKTRRENFDLASILIQRRNDSLEIFKDYITFDQDQIAHNMLSIPGVEYNTDILFIFEEFEATFDDQHIFYNHHFDIQGQLPNLMTDKFIQPLSTKLDNLLKEIHQYTPDPNEIQSNKADRLKERILELNQEFQTFESSVDKNEHEAKIIKTSCDFILSEMEALNLNGVEISVQRLGTDRFQMKRKIVYLEQFLIKQKAEKDRQLNEQKSATTEISKSLTLNSLPPLKSSLNYLQWRATLNRLFSHYKSELSRMALIRNSVVRVTDKKRLDTMQSSDEMLSYLQNIFGSLDYILPLTFKKLTSLPIADDVFTVQRNYEEFARTIQLLRDNDILDKLDRYVMESLLNKILTANQREKYFSEVLVQESQWKEEAGIESDPSNLNTLINTNSHYESLRRDHFLNFCEQSYETTRRLTTNYMFETRFSKSHKKVKNTRNYQTDLKEKQFPKCLFCSQEVHVLTKCPKFNAMTPVERKNKLKSSNKYCNRCLYYVKDWKEHKINKGLCPLQRRSGNCGKCKRYTNHHGIIP